MPYLVAHKWERKSVWKRTCPQIALLTQDKRSDPKTQGLKNRGRKIDPRKVGVKIDPFKENMTLDDQFIVEEGRPTLKSLL